MEIDALNIDGMEVAVMFPQGLSTALKGKKPKLAVYNPESETASAQTQESKPVLADAAPSPAEQSPAKQSRDSKMV